MKKQWDEGKSDLGEPCISTRRKTGFIDLESTPNGLHISVTNYGVTANVMIFNNELKGLIEFLYEHKGDHLI